MSKKKKSLYFFRTRRRDEVRWRWVGIIPLRIEQLRCSVDPLDVKYVFLVKIPIFDGKQSVSSQRDPRQRSYCDDNSSGTSEIVQYENGHSTSSRNSCGTFSQYQSKCSEMTSFRTLINILFFRNYDTLQRHSSSSSVHCRFVVSSKVVIFTFWSDSLLFRFFLVRTALRVQLRRVSPEY